LPDSPKTTGTYLRQLAIGYAAFTIMDALKNGQPSKDNPFSPIFIAHQLHRDTNYHRGMAIKRGLDTFRQYGTLPFNQYSRDFRAVPEARHLKDAAKYKPATYQQIYSKAANKNEDIVAILSN
jgi:hypothetical protein